MLEIIIMRLFVSDTDSFIEEVSEEVRRDRLYKVLRKYAWVGILAGVTIVGGTAFLEFQKAQARTEAEAVGTAIINALDISNLEERAEELRREEEKQKRIALQKKADEEERKRKEKEEAEAKEKAK